jgi:hypothetical protein
VATIEGHAAKEVDRELSDLVDLARPRVGIVARFGRL